MSDDPTPGVTREMRPHGDGRKVGQVIHCDQCGGNDVAFTNKSGFLPPVALRHAYSKPPRFKPWTSIDALDAARLMWPSSRRFAPSAWHPESWLQRAIDT